MSQLCLIYSIRRLEHITEALISLQWTRCRVSSLILFLTLITSSAGALELDSMLWRLRSQRVIIIIIIIIIMCSRADRL